MPNESKPLAPPLHLNIISPPTRPYFKGDNYDKIKNDINFTPKKVNTEFLNIDSHKSQEMWLVNLTTKDSLEALQRGDNIYSIIDPKKCINIGVLLHHVSLSIDEIVNLISDGKSNIDFTSDVSDRLRVLLKNLPNSSDVFGRLKNFNYTDLKLGSAEKLCLKLSKLDNPRLLIDFCAMKLELEHLYFGVVTSLDIVFESCKVILTSETLKDIFMLVLVAGNYLNRGSSFYTANDSKLSSIQLLADIKSNDAEGFFNFVVHELETKPEKNDRSEDGFKDLEVLKNSSSSMTSLWKDMEKMKFISSKAKHLCQEASESTPIPWVQKSTNQLSEKFERANNKIKYVQEVIKHVAKYLNEDEKTFEIDECLQILSHFSRQCLQIKLENDHLKRLNEEHGKTKTSISFNNSPKKENQESVDVELKNSNSNAGKYQDAIDDKVDDNNNEIIEAEIDSNHESLKSESDRETTPQPLPICSTPLIKYMSRIDITLSWNSSSNHSPSFVDSSNERCLSELQLSSICDSNVDSKSNENVSISKMVDNENATKPTKNLKFSTDQRISTERRNISKIPIVPGQFNRNIIKHLNLRNDLVVTRSNDSLPIKSEINDKIIDSSHSPGFTHSPGSTYSPGYSHSLGSTYNCKIKRSPAFRKHRRPSIKIFRMERTWKKLSEIKPEVKSDVSRDECFSHRLYIKNSPDRLI